MAWWEDYLHMLGIDRNRPCRFGVLVVICKDFRCRKGVFAKGSRLDGHASLMRRARIDHCYSGGITVYFRYECSHIIGQSGPAALHVEIAQPYV